MFLYFIGTFITFFVYSSVFFIAHAILANGSSAKISSTFDLDPIKGYDHCQSLFGENGIVGIAGFPFGINLFI